MKYRIKIVYYMILKEDGITTDVSICCLVVTKVRLITKSRFFTGTMYTKKGCNRSPETSLQWKSRPGRNL